VDGGDWEADLKPITRQKGVCMVIQDHHTSCPLKTREATDLERS